MYELNPELLTWRNRLCSKKNFMARLLYVLNFKSIKGLVLEKMTFKYFHFNTHGHQITWLSSPNFSRSSELDPSQMSNAQFLKNYSLRQIASQVHVHVYPQPLYTASYSILNEQLWESTLSNYAGFECEALVSVFEVSTLPHYESYTPTCLSHSHGIIKCICTGASWCTHNGRVSTAHTMHKHVSYPGTCTIQYMIAIFKSPPECTKRLRSYI